MARAAAHSLWALNPDRIRVFSYGSNSTAQLAGRVENPGLVTHPAHLTGFTRVFCMRSDRWGRGGSVASLAPLEGAVTYGNMAELTPEEKGMLNAYEGGYREVTVRVVVGSIDGPQHEVDAIVYIAGKEGKGMYTLPWVGSPSEAYLTAIHVMMREHWLTMCVSIPIRGLVSSDDATVTVVTYGDWKHPGCDSLGLEALAVEMNAARSDKECMPIAMIKFCEAVQNLGVKTTTELAATLADDVLTAEMLEVKCVEKGLKPGTIAALRKLQLHRLFVYGTLLARQSNHHKMEDARLIDDAAMTETTEFLMLHKDSLHYPYSVPETAIALPEPERTRTPLKGEVYCVSTEHLHGPLDKLEDYPAHYNRIRVPIVNHKVPAIMYVLSNQVLLQSASENIGGKYAVVPNGDWRSYWSRPDCS